MLAALVRQAFKGSGCCSDVCVSAAEWRKCKRLIISEMLVLRAAHAARKTSNVLISRLLCLLLPAYTVKVGAVLFTGFGEFLL